MIEIFAPCLAALGFNLVLSNVLKRDAWPARALMAGISVALALRYFVWRVTETLPAPGFTGDYLVGYPFLLAEGASLVAVCLSLFFLTRTVDRTADVERALQGESVARQPLIDVLICTYNEERAILERTMIGATGLNYSNYRVWVLDDGRRPWLQELAEELGCRYLTRPDNSHAKAGNINHALDHLATLPLQPDFISILDADFVPLPEFLRRTVALLADGTVGVVQTPQHFVNPDPIQANLIASKVWPDEQRFFFDILMPSKDAWGVAFCCGTSSVIRFAGLREIGGFPTDSVTEDYLVTLRLKERGYRTIYLNERLTLGLAPEGLKEYITQRGRWCLGFMQIVRGKSGPFSLGSRLSFTDRLSLIDSFLGWTTSYGTKTLGMVVPWLFLIFGIKAVHADLFELLGYFLPFYIWHTSTMSWISGGRSLTIMTDISQYVAAPAVLKAVFTGLLRPQGHKFKVTAKGGDRNRRFVEWPLVKIFASALAISMFSIVYAFIIRSDGEAIAYGGLAFVWSLYNCAVLALLCFICIEQPRRRKSERLSSDEKVVIEFGESSRMTRLVDLSVTGARFIDPHPPEIGVRLRCFVDGRALPATVMRHTRDGFGVQFEETSASRIQAVRLFYARQYLRTSGDVRALPLGKAIIARIMQ